MTYVPNITSLQGVLNDSQIPDAIARDSELPGVFGTEFDYSETAGPVNTAGAFGDRHTHTTPSVPAGDYIVGWYFEYNNDDNSAGDGGDFKVRVDGVDVNLIEGIQHDNSANVFVSSSGQVKLIFTAATHTITIQSRAVSGISRIRTMKTWIFRVS